jgi:hypothetical protein
MIGLWGPAMGPLLPDQDRYRPLPLLVRCSECRALLRPVETWTAVVEGIPRRGLCRSCADSLADSLA